MSDFRADLLKGKVVLVTGGATGIGFGICTVFGKHGAKVVMGGRRAEKLKEACDKLSAMGIEAAGFTCDVRDAEKCKELAKQAVERFGRIDVLVNNAAGNFSVPLEKLTPNGFKTVMEIDLHGTFNMAQAALPALKETRGVIINISATLHYKAFPFQAHASAAKSAIDVLTSNIGVEWGTDYGIRCVSIAPGPIEGTVGGPGGRVFGKMMEAVGALNDPRMIVPLGRYGTVEDIANTALFICSSAGSYINATTIVVDGGQWHESSARYLIAKQMIEAASNKERASHKGGVELKPKL